MNTYALKILKNTNNLEILTISSSTRQILEQMVSTTEVFADIITISSVAYVPLKKTNVSKSLCQISETLDVNPKTAVRWLSYAESNHKAIRAGSMLCSSIKNRRANNKINEWVKKDLYNWIL